MCQNKCVRNHLKSLGFKWSSDPWEVTVSLRAVARRLLLHFELLVCYQLEIVVQVGLPFV